MRKNVIEINNLSKSFGDVKAVNDISFKVREGELFAFLGVNGAGKSTTINILCGQLAKDCGEIKICDMDLDKGIDKIKRSLGVVFQNSVLDSSLTVKENLESRAALYGITGNNFKNRLKELTEIFEFENLLNRTVSKLSGGQRRRIDIARALIHKPQILILDEPTTGLDPQTRKLIWDIIEKLRKEDKMTVFLTTHYMEEAANASYVVIINEGKIAVHGTPLELKNAFTGDFITLYDVDKMELDKVGLNYQKVHKAYRIQVENTAKATELIIKYPKLFRDYEVEKGKMDDVFLTVTGIKLDNSISNGGA